MYCRHCGAQLKDGARFCAGCGAEVAAEPAAIEAAPAANETGASFGEAVDRGKRRSMRKMSPILAIALTFALAAGTAFAAYYVYTEVIEPANRGEAVEEPDVQADFETTYDYEMDSHVIEARKLDGEIQEVTILYPRFSVDGGGSGEAVDAVNKMIRADAEALDIEVNCYATSARVFTASTYSYTVEYDSDGVVSLRRPTYFRVWVNPKGIPRDSLTFDMTTGERLSAASAVGLTDDELTDYAYEAIDRYAANNTGIDQSTSNYKDNREWTVSGSGPCFYLDDKGVVMAPAQFFLGGHGADKELYVYAFEDQSIVGTCAHDHFYGTD